MSLLKGPGSPSCDIVTGPLDARYRYLNETLASSFTMTFGAAWLTVPPWFVVPSPPSQVSVLVFLIPTFMLRSTLHVPVACTYTYFEPRLEPRLVVEQRARHEIERCT